MTFWAYLLHCRGGAFYVGHTDNLDQRIGQHQTGAIAGFTSQLLPVSLVWSQDFPTRYQAKEAERRIKGWGRAKKIALIRGDWKLTSRLTKGKNGPSTSSRKSAEGESFAPISDNDLIATVVVAASLSPHPARPELVEGLSFALLSHPDTPPKDVRAVTGSVCGSGAPGHLRLEYRAEGIENLEIPGPLKPARVEGLWRGTCFEMFMKIEGAEAYTEYNFSPSGEWAAYGFDGYRANMRHAPMADPQILSVSKGDAFVLSVAAGPMLPPGELQIALCAVIEETDGTKSYWALAHPPEGPPDFHHRDCFALTLPAPDGA